MSAMNYRVGASKVVHQGSDWAYETMCGLKAENSPLGIEWSQTYDLSTCKRCNSLVGMALRGGESRWDYA